MASVDVVVPCYQHGRFLRQCVTSILSQDMEDLRVLIIDNASSDDSASVARQLAAEDRRVKVVVHRTNLGPHASFNEGIDWASASYFMILCADDMLTPGSLARAVAVLERHREATLAIGKDIEFRGFEEPAIGEIVQAHWQVRDGSAFIAQLCRRPARYVAAGTAVVRTSAQKRIGHYRPELPYTDDLEMLLRLASVGHVAETTAVQGMRRLHCSNMSNSFLAERVTDLIEREAAFRSFFAREGKTMAGAAALNRLLRRGLAEQAYWWGVRDLCSGDARSARKLFRFAFKRRPVTAVLPPVSGLFDRDRAIGRLAGSFLNSVKRAA